MSRPQWPDSINSPSEIPGTIQLLAVMEADNLSKRQVESLRADLSYPFIDSAFQVACGVKRKLFWAHIV